MQGAPKISPPQLYLKGDLFWERPPPHCPTPSTHQNTSGKSSTCACTTLLQINWNIGTVQVMRGRNFWAGIAASSREPHLSMLTLCPPSTYQGPSCMMQPILIKGQKSDKLAQGSCAGVRTRSACMILSQIGRLNSVWKIGKDDGLIWTLSFCYLSLLWDDNNTPKTKTPQVSKYQLRSVHMLPCSFLTFKSIGCLGQKFWSMNQDFTLWQIVKVVELSKTEPNNKPWSVQLINKIRDIDNDSMM